MIDAIHHFKSTWTEPLCLSGSVFLLQPNKRQKDFGVGIMLKGGGTVEPVSKYDIHNLVLANFHSVSDFSEIT